MSAIKKVYEGYKILQGDEKETEESKILTDALMQVLYELLTDDQADEVFGRACDLIRHKEQQGFIAGFAYAMRINLECAHALTF